MTFKWFKHTVKWEGNIRLNKKHWKTHPLKQRMPYESIISSWASYKNYVLRISVLFFKSVVKKSTLSVTYSFLNFPKHWNHRTFKQKYERKRVFCPLCAPSIHPSLIKKSYFLINHFFALPTLICVKKTSRTQRFS
jgi:hypothetical protein